MTEVDATTPTTYTYSITSGNAAGKFRFDGTTTNRLETAADINLDTGDDAVSVSFTQSSS